MKIVLAGASGFVGRALLQKIAQSHEVIALSRAKSNSPAPEKIEWRKCDLFSLLETEKALEGAEIGIYLVHSMMPTAELSQGSFEDFDLIVADNFLRAAKKAGIKQIIYLSGIMPNNLQHETSLHLKSRKEVEDLFLKSEIPTTILRAAMVLGPEGSSFHIMTRLVCRLPLMVCPRWASTKSQPVALSDVVEAISFSVNKKELFGQIRDVAGPDILSYREMMQKTAQQLGLHRIFIPVTVLSPKLSRLWIRLVTGAPKNLIDPLIHSLKYEMLANPQQTLQFPAHNYLKFDEALKSALSQFTTKKAPLAFRQPPVEEKMVRSVQRLPLPSGWTAETVALAYIRWLPKLLPWFITTKKVEHNIEFSFKWLPISLLKLEYSPERSGIDRQLFYIRGGFLAQKKGKGRLEFREVKEHTAILAAIHNYSPALPWYIYRWSQALVHLWVMRQFRYYLQYKKDH